MIVRDMNTQPVHRSVDTSGCLVEPSLINQEPPYDFPGNPHAIASGRIGEIKSIYQSIVLPLLECLYQDVSTLRTGDLINDDFHSEVSSELCA
jgi:hypothetical protein